MSRLEESLAALRPASDVMAAVRNDPAGRIYDALDRIERRAKLHGNINTQSDVEIIRANLEKL